MENFNYTKTIFHFLLSVFLFFTFVAIVEASSKPLSQENFSGPTSVVDCNCEIWELDCKNEFQYRHDHEHHHNLL